MRLLIFAHRGEASSFIKGLGCKMHTTAENLSYWSNSRDFILVCGEGSLSCAVTLAHFLTSFKPRISEIVNLGVAGSLLNDDGLQKIYEIRTVYGEESKNKIAYQSFSTDCPHGIQSLVAPNQPPSKDCVSASQRVLDSEYAHELAHYAPIVDRELWTIAFICKKFNLPWRSIKIISDRPTANPQTFSCEWVADQSSEFSSRLFEYYQTHFLQKKSPQSPVVTDAAPNLFKGLHTTHSQTIALSRLLKTLERQRQLTSATLFRQLEADNVIREIIALKIPSKQKTQRIIQYIESMVSPVKKEVFNQLRNLQKRFKNKGIAFHFDPELESRSFNIKKSFKTNKDFDEFKKNLSEIDSNEFFAIMDGETIDV